MVSAYGTETSRSHADFLCGGGEMGSLIRAFNWAASPVGDPAEWPQALRTIVRLILSTNHPMFIFWGRKCGRKYDPLSVRKLIR